MQLDFSDLEIVDVHSHPFRALPTVFEKIPIELCYYFGTSSFRYLLGDNVWQSYRRANTAEKASLDKEHHISATRQLFENSAKSTIFSFLIKNELGRFLGCPPEQDKIAQERSKRASADYSKYVKSLYDQVNLKTLIVDPGYPQEENIPLKPFEEFMPVRVKFVADLDKISGDLLAENKGLNFEEFLCQFDERLHKTLAEGAIGIKSLIAYTSGLAVEKQSQGSANKDYEEIRSGGLSLKEAKRFNDFFFLRGWQCAMEFEVPLQVHSGFGDIAIDPLKANPLFLGNLLKDKNCKKGRLIITHAGYPYLAEAGYMCNVFPNTFLDLSLFHTFAPPSGNERFKTVLENAPLSKILYASDAFFTPECAWLTAKVAKRVMEHTFSDLITEGVMTVKEALQMAKMILSENAKGLFKLS